MQIKRQKTTRLNTDAILTLMKNTIHAHGMAIR
jgi:hypothetical protein